MAGLVLSFLIGLLVGGLIGGWGIALLQQIRAGRVKVPPSLSFGPLKIDLSGLVPEPDDDGEPTADWSEMSPAIEIGGSLTGGCLSLIAAVLVFIGFVLPWASFNLILVSGAFSGLSVLVQIIIGLLLALLGTFVGGGLGLNQGNFGDALGVGAAGGFIVLILLLAALFLITIPLMGYRIGKVGISLLKSPRMSKTGRDITQRNLRRAALIGFVPAFCYFITAAGGVVQQASRLGISVNNADVGLWVTLGGFSIAIIAGIIISITASFADQMSK